MLRESDFKKYFEGHISAESLVEIIHSGHAIERSIPELPASTDSPVRTEFVYHKDFHDLKEDFVLQRIHILKLCNDFLADHLTVWDLDDITFLLHACDSIIWDFDSEEGVLIGDVISDWSMHELDNTITKENVEKVVQKLTD